MPFDRRRLAVMAAGFCSFLDLHAPQSLLPELARVFGASAAAAGLVMSATTLAVAVAAPVAGGIGDRLGRKRTIVVAALLAALPTAFAGLSGSLDQLVAWRFVQGLLLPAIFTVTVAQVSDHWAPKEAADVVGLYLTGSIVGGFSGRVVAAAVAEWAGWPSSFLVLAAINLAAAAVIAAWLPSDRRHDHAALPATGFVTALRSHLVNGRLLANCGVGFSVLFAIVGTFTYVNFRLAGAPFHLPTGMLGLVFAVYLAGMVTTPLSGMAFRRFGRRATTAAAFAAGAAGLALTLVPHLGTAIAGLGLFAGGIFVGQSAGMGDVPRAVDHSKATAVGLYVTAYYLGGSAGGVVPGLLWERHGWAGCVTLIAAVMAAGLLCGLWAWRGSTTEAIPEPAAAE